MLCNAVMLQAKYNMIVFRSSIVCCARKQSSCFVGFCNIKIVEASAMLAQTAYRKLAVSH